LLAWFYAAALAGVWSAVDTGLSLHFAGRRHIPARLCALIDLIREPTPAAA
jgi:hypothetical protein